MSIEVFTAPFFQILRSNRRPDSTLRTVRTVQLDRYKGLRFPQALGLTGEEYDARFQEVGDPVPNTGEYHPTLVDNSLKPWQMLDQWRIPTATLRRIWQFDFTDTVDTPQSGKPYVVYSKRPEIIIPGNGSNGHVEVPGLRKATVRELIAIGIQHLSEYRQDDVPITAEGSNVIGEPTLYPSLSRISQIGAVFDLVDTRKILSRPMLVTTVPPTVVQ